MRPDDSVVRYIARFLERYENQLSVSLAERAQKQSLQLDEASELIGAGEVVQPDFARGPVQAGAL